ncbi:hypothetical protein P171DRAFT_437532 [Karstenula rhodostoma CBS 690.94]|uniref:Uncharacterized protein n=1 Tax=Karstenula rhodostoma CBS 690.94 TaxID=1392251 RepID=A0A9P4P5Q3_9PLEO|nr:hypothetical protein P171DRAFT_437532 [Karstenula rhodostoma CBS 690.94]
MHRPTVLLPPVSSFPLDRCHTPSHCAPPAPPLAKPTRIRSVNHIWSRAPPSYPFPFRIHLHPHHAHNPRL